MSKKPHLAGIAFAIIFGFTFMFSKTALEHVAPAGLIAYRFLVAFLAFEALRLAKVVHIRFSRVKLRVLLPVVLLQPVLYFLFETHGLARTTSGEAGMMIALIPIFVSIFGALILKEKPRRAQLFFILLSVGGIILIQIFKLTDDLTVHVAGLFLLFGAVLSAALFNIASRHASQSMKAHEITYFMMLVGAVTFNMIHLTSLILEGEASAYLSLMTARGFLLPVLYLGLVASIGGFFLLNYALGRLQAHVISIYANLATVTAIVAGAIFLSEPITYYHVVGALMIVTGVYGVVRTNRPPRRKEKFGRNV